MPQLVRFKSINIRFHHNVIEQKLPNNDSSLPPHDCYPEPYSMTPLGILEITTQKYEYIRVICDVND